MEGRLSLDSYMLMSSYQQCDFGVIISISTSFEMIN